MWLRSNDRQLRALLGSGPQEPVPDTLRARLQADVETRFGQPRAAPGILRRAAKTIRKKPLLAVAAVLLVALFIATPVLVATNWETERFVWAAKTALQLREFAITYARGMVGAATGFPLPQPLGTIADGLDHRASLLRTFEGYGTLLLVQGPDRPRGTNLPDVMQTRFYAIDEDNNQWLIEVSWHDPPEADKERGMGHRVHLCNGGVLAEKSVEARRWNLRDAKEPGNRHETLMRDGLCLREWGNNSWRRSFLQLSDPAVSEETVDGANCYRIAGDMLTPYPGYSVGMIIWADPDKGFAIRKWAHLYIRDGQVFEDVMAHAYDLREYAPGLWLPQRTKVVRCTHQGVAERTLDKAHIYAFTDVKVNDPLSEDYFSPYVFKGARPEIPYKPKTLDDDPEETERRETLLRQLLEAQADPAALIEPLPQLLRTPNVLVAVLNAMARVRTAHIVSAHGEIWFSRDHGLRREYGRTVRVSTSEALWEYDTDTNKVTIADPEPDPGKELLEELSGSRWLDALREGASSLRFRVSETVLDGTPVKRIDAKDSEARVIGTIWIDASTMRVIAIDEWDLQEDASRTTYVRSEVEYDMPLDAALFTFEPPADATIVDCRIDSELREVIQQAIKAVKTLPMHEIGEEAPLYHNDTRRFYGFDKWEGWRQNGVGERTEYVNGTVNGATPQQRWAYSTKAKDGYITDRDPSSNSFFTSQAHAWLRGLQTGRAGGYPADAKPEVIRGEKDGRRLARVVGYFTSRPPSIEKKQLPERSKEVLTLDLDAKRLVERELYIWLDDQWRLAEHVELDYPDELPPGIFEPDPPAGVHLDDLRNVAN